MSSLQNLSSFEDSTKMEKAKRTASIVGIAILIIAIIYLTFSIVLGNSWTYGVGNYPVVSPNCDPACATGESCEFYKDGSVLPRDQANLISALKSDSKCLAANSNAYK